MSDVNANVNINIETSGALVNLKRLESEINQFQKTVAASNTTASQNQQALNRALLDGIRNTGMFDAKIVSAHDSVARFNDQLDRGKLSLGQYTRYAASQLPGMSKVFKKEFDTIQQVAESRVKKINTQYIALGKTVDGVTRAIAATPTTLGRGYATDLALATQRQQLFNKMIDDGSTKLLNWGKNTQWAGRQLMVGFSIPLAALGTVASKTFMEIDKSTVALKRVYGDLNTTAGEINSNVDALKSLGKEYTKYGIALSETIDIGARAAATGAKNEDLIAATEQTMRLATLGQIDYNQALDATISLQSAFGISSSDLGETIDYLNTVENQTILTLDDMTLAVPRVATVIKGLGGDVKDLAVFMTAMREGGVSAENAANALKSGLASLINPTKAAKEYLGGLGINIQKIVQTNKGDLMGIITTFGKALNSLDDFQRQQALEKVFGKYQYARMGALFSNITKDSSQAARAMDIAKMSAQELADVANKELSTVSESTSVKFQAAMEQLKISIAPLGEAFLKGITPVVNMVSKIADAFNNLPDGVKNAVAVITVALAGLGPVLLMSIGLLGNGLANIVKGVQFLRRNLARIRGDGAVFDYMSAAELEAVAATNSLNTSANNLVGTLNLQKRAVAALTVEYERFAAAAGIAGGAMRGVGGAPMPGGGKPGMRMVRRNQGGTIPGSGNTDTVPAMLTPGEFVVNKQSTAENLPLLRAINNGNVSGYARGGITGKTSNVQYLGIGDIVRTFTKVSGRSTAALPRALTGTASGFANSQKQRIIDASSALGRTNLKIENLSGKEVQRGHVVSGIKMDDKTEFLPGLMIFQSSPINQLLAGNRKGVTGEAIAQDLANLKVHPFSLMLESARKLGIPDTQSIPALNKTYSEALKEFQSIGTGVLKKDQFYAIFEPILQKNLPKSLYDNLRLQGSAREIGGSAKSFGKYVMSESSEVQFRNKGGLINGLRYAPPGGQVSQSRSFYGIPPIGLMKKASDLRRYLSATHGTTYEKTWMDPLSREGRSQINVGAGMESSAVHGPGIYQGPNRSTLASYVPQTFENGGQKRIMYKIGRNTVPEDNTFYPGRDNIIYRNPRSIKEIYKLIKSKGYISLEEVELMVKKGILPQNTDGNFLYRNQALRDMGYRGIISPGGGASGEIIDLVSGTTRSNSMVEIGKLSKLYYTSIFRSREFLNNSTMKQINMRNLPKDLVAALKKRKAEQTLRNMNDEEYYAMSSKMATLNSGGIIPMKFATGDTVPGMGNTDTVPAMLTPGEFVVNKKATQNNLNLLRSINSGNIKGYAEGDVVQSSRTGYSAPPPYANQTAQMQWKTMAREQDAARRAAERWNIAGTKLSNALEKVTAHIVSPAPGPIKSWIAKNLTPDLQAINNYMNRVQKVSRNMLTDTQTLQKISKSTGLSLERVKVELNNFAKGQHPITEKSARVLEKVASMDEAASRMAQQQGRKTNIFGARSETGYLAGMTRGILKERRLGGNELYRQRGAFRYTGSTVEVRRQSTASRGNRRISAMTEPTPHGMINGQRQSYSNVSMRAKEIMNERGLVGQQGRQEALRLARQEMAPPRRSFFGGGKFGMMAGGFGNALMMGSMMPVMTGGGDPNAKFLGMDPMAASMGMMGLGTIASLIPMFSGAAGGLAAIAAPAAAVLVPLVAIAGTMIILQKNAENAAEAAGKAGANLGVTANSLNKISQVFGVATPAQKQKQLDLKISDKELSKVAEEFQPILSSESGQAFIKELKDATSSERAKKFTDYLRAGVASGLFDEEQAKRFAKVIGIVVGDTVMTTIAIKGLAGVIQGAEGYLEIARQRKMAAPQQALNALQQSRQSGIQKVKFGPDYAKTPLSSDESSKIIGFALQGIQDYTNVLAMAQQEVDSGKMSLEKYNAIVEESNKQQKTYAENIRDSILYSDNLQATLVATEKQFQDLGMSAEGVQKLGESLEGLGKDISPLARATYYAEAGAAYSQGMSETDIQAIVDYTIANQNSAAAKALQNPKYAGQGMQLAGLGMLIQEGAIPGLKPEDAQRQIDIAFNFTEHGGTVARYQQFLSSLPQNKVITIETDFKGMSPEDQAAFINGYNNIAALGGVDLAVTVMFDENGKPKNGKDLADTVEKTSKALNKMKSGKTKVKKEGIFELSQIISSNLGQNLTPEQLEKSYNELIDKYGEQKILNLPTDIISKALIFDFQIDEISAQLIDLYAQLQAATPGSEEYTNIALKIARLSQARLDIQRQLGDLMAGDYSLGGDEKPSGAGAGAGGTKSFKDQLLDQIKLFVDATATMKKLNDAKKNFMKEIAKGAGLLTQVSNIPVGMSPTLVDYLSSLTPDELKKWMKENTKKTKGGGITLNKQGALVNRRVLEAGIGRTITETNFGLGFQQQQMTAANLMTGRFGGKVPGLGPIRTDLMQKIVGDPEAATQLVQLYKNVQNNVKGAKQSLREFINDQQKLLDNEKDLARLMDPIQAEIDDQTIAHNKITKEIEDQKQVLQDQIDAYDKQIEQLQELNSADQHRIDGLNRQKEMIQRAIDGLERQNEMDRRRIDALRHEDELRNRVADALSHDLEILGQQEEAIRTGYQKRIDALNKVAQINQHIIEQQQQQVGLSQALSQGDIYAAAGQVLQSQQSNAAFAAQQQQNALQQGQENAIAGLRTAGGLTRDQAEKQIANIKEQSYQTSLKIQVIEDAIYNRNLSITKLKDDQYNIDLAIIPIQDAIYDREQSIYDIQTNKMKPLQKQIDLLDEQLDTENRLFQSKIDQLELDKLQGEMIETQKQRVGDLVEQWDGVRKIIGDINNMIASGGQATAGMAVPRPKPREDPKDYAARLNTFKQSVQAAIDAAEAKKKVKQQEDAAKDQNKFAGGFIRAATGMMIPGTGGMDTVPVMATPGEFVMRKASVKKYGAALMQALNTGSFNLPKYNVPSVGTVVVQPARNTNASINAPVYNGYSVNVNVAGTNASADEIASRTITRIKEMQNVNIRSARG